MKLGMSLTVAAASVCWPFLRSESAATVSRQFYGEIYRGDDAVGSRDSFPGNIKRGAVIGARPGKWKAQRDVHSFVKGMQL